MKKRGRPRLPKTVSIQTISGVVVNVARYPYTSLLKKLAEQGASNVLVHLQASGKLIISYNVGTSTGRMELEPQP